MGGTRTRDPGGLQRKHGLTRVFDAPIAEAGIVGTAVGMGAYGLGPVVEIQFADCIYPATDQLISEAERLRYRTAGEWRCPLTVRAPYGGSIFGGQTHSQSPEAIFTHVAGLKTVIPSNPYDAKGLLISAIEDDDPVMFFEPKRLYNGPFDGHHEKQVQPWSKFADSQVPEGYYTVQLGKAAIVRLGSDATVLAYGTMVHVAMAAVDETGIDAEVIDLRSLVPLDIETIISSVTKTGSCVIVHEATLTGGFGAELAALVQHRCFYSLESRIERIAGWDTPYPHAFEWNYFPCQIRSPIQNPPCSAGPSTDDIFRDGLLEMITAWAYLDAVNVVCWLNDAEPCEPDSGLHPGECDRRARLACAGG